MKIDPIVGSPDAIQRRSGDYRLKAMRGRGVGISSVKNAWRIILALLGCIHLCGGPQGLMQCVAWAGMLVSYSQEGTVAEAVEKTFDGEHPCPLCLAIEKAKEKQPSPAGPGRTPSGGDVLKLCKDMLPLELCTVPLISFCHERTEKPGGVDETARRRNAEPPSPPPRNAAKV